LHLVDPRVYGLDILEELWQFLSVCLPEQLGALQQWVDDAVDECTSYFEFVLYVLFECLKYGFFSLEFL
jgi:hypothetical protein